MTNLLVISLPLVLLGWLALSLYRLESPGGPDVEPWGEPTSEPWYPTPPEEPESWGFDDDEDESSRSMEDSSGTPPRLRVSSTQ